MRSLLTIGACVVIFLSAVLPTSARTWFVPSEAPTIQAGIDSAAVGDTVLVACGTYYEHDIHVEPGLTLTSETGLADCVTVDAQNLGRAFYCGGDLDSLTSIVGLTITGGLVLGEWPDGAGGGMYCDGNTRLMLTSCTFSGNRCEGGASGGGGGLYCGGSWSAYWPHLTNCTFSGNTAVGSHGGGILCWTNSRPVLTGVTFAGNTSDRTGGGMSCYSSHPTLTGCTFIENTSGRGGGLEVFSAHLNANGCVFSGNAAGGNGGGVDVWWSGGSFTDCTFVGNSAASGGGAFCDTANTPTFANCTFAGNSRHAIHLYNCYYPMTIVNSILAFSSEGSGLWCDGPAPCAATTTQSCVFGNADGDSLCGEYSDNMFVDPLFCEPPTADVSLCSDSPCLPSGNSWGELVGAHGSGCGPCGSSAVVETSWGNLKALYR